MEHVLRQGEIGLVQDLLIYGKEYDLWRDGDYIGTATYTDDPNIGDCFLKTIINDKGEKEFEVHISDQWMFA